jgi:ABC-2 type transport system ATP-binding protein
VRLVVLVAGLLLIPTLPALPAAGADWQEGRNDSIIEMADGTLIDATMWIPTGTAPGARLPAIVIIHGYGGSKAVGDAHRAADHGYVGFAYSTRGFGESTGHMDVAGPASIADLKALVAWLKANGPVDAARVGVTGASYGGGHSLQIATDPDAGVATVVPIVPWSDLGKALFPNRVFKLSYASGFYATGNGLVQSGDQPVELEVAGVDVGRRQLYDTYDPSVHVSYAEAVAGLGQSDLDAFARARSAAVNVDKITIPIFIIQGLSDDLFPGDQALGFFEQIPAKDKKLYLGFVGHPRARGAGPEADYLYEQLYAWFDFYLKGTGESPVSKRFPIEVGKDVWDGTTLKLQAWPSPDGGFPLALNGDGSLGAPATPAVGQLVNTFAAGFHDEPVVFPTLGVDDGAAQLPDSTPLDTLAFRSGELTQATELLGTPRAELRLTAVGRSYQVAVKLYDVAPDGTATLVTRGIWGAPDHVSPLPERVVVDLQPYRHTFGAGHRVEVRVAASDFPTYMPEKTPFALLIDLGAGGSVVRLPLSTPLP